MTTTPSPLASFLEALPIRTFLETLSQLQQAVLVVDRRGRVVWLSDSLGLFCDATSLTLGRRTDNLFVDRSQLDDFVRQILTQGRIPPSLVEVRAVGGGSTRVEFSAVRLPGALPEPLFLATVRPAPAHEETSRPEYLPPQVSLAAILDNSPEAVLTLDGEGVVTYANPALERLLGYSREDIVSQPLLQLLACDEGTEQALGTLLSSEQGETRDIRISRADGVPRCVCVSAGPLSDADGPRRGAVVFLRDVTEERSRIGALARTNTELESYVHSVSHDLRSPLVSLLGFSRLLRQDHGDQLGDSGRHFLERIEQAGRTMEALINDLLELSRIGETAERKTLVDPRRTLSQLRAELKPRLEARGVELVICERPPLLLCDRTRLYQVFSNLVGNALDHMGSCTKPRIEIDVREEPEVHHLTVRDYGRGIDPRHHERIFEIFQSLGPRADGRRGTGVGLAIVKKIAETHGGRVWVESAPGQGACFHLTLPRA
jgi:PAS domain S-box-containing protein